METKRLPLPLRYIGASLVNGPVHPLVLVAAFIAFYYNLAEYVEGGRSIAHKGDLQLQFLAVIYISHQTLNLIKLPFYKFVAGFSIKYYFKRESQIDYWHLLFTPFFLLMLVGTPSNNLLAFVAFPVFYLLFLMVGPMELFWFIKFLVQKRKNEDDVGRG